MAKHAKAKHTEGLKYGDPKFKKRPTDRTLTPEEELFIIAEYQKYGDAARGAKAVGCDLEAAIRVIAEAAEKNPQILADPRVLLYKQIEMSTISAMALERARKNMEGLYGKPAVETSYMAQRRADTFGEAYRKRTGVPLEDLDLNKIAIELKEAEAELERLTGLTPTAGGPKDQTSDGGSQAAGAVGEDAGGGDERT